MVVWLSAAQFLFSNVAIITTMTADRIGQASERSDCLMKSTDYRIYQASLKPQPLTSFVKKVYLLLRL